MRCGFQLGQPAGRILHRCHHQWAAPYSSGICAQCSGNQTETLCFHARIYTLISSRLTRENTSAVIHPARIIDVVMLTSSNLNSYRICQPASRLISLLFGNWRPGLPQSLAWNRYSLVDPFMRTAECRPHFMGCGLGMSQILSSRILRTWQQAEIYEDLRDGLNGRINRHYNSGGWTCRGLQSAIFCRTTSGICKSFGSESAHPQYSNQGQERATGVM